MHEELKEVRVATVLTVTPDNRLELTDLSLLATKDAVKLAEAAGYTFVLFVSQEMNKIVVAESPDGPRREIGSPDYQVMMLTSPQDQDSSAAPEAITMAESTYRRNLEMLTPFGRATVEPARLVCLNGTLWLQDGQNQRVYQSFLLIESAAHAVKEHFQQSVAELLERQPNDDQLHKRSKQKLPLAARLRQSDQGRNQQESARAGHTFVQKIPAAIRYLFTSERQSHRDAQQSNQEKAAGDLQDLMAVVAPYLVMAVSVKNVQPPIEIVRLVGPVRGTIDSYAQSTDELDVASYVHEVVLQIIEALEPTDATDLQFSVYKKCLRRAAERSLKSLQSRVAS